MINLKNIFIINFNQLEIERKKVKLREIFIVNIQIVQNHMDPKIHYINMYEINIEILRKMYINKDKNNIFKKTVSYMMVQRVVIILKIESI